MDGRTGWKNGKYNICGGILFVPTTPDVYIQFWVWDFHVGSGDYWYHKGEYKNYPEHLRLQSFFWLLYNG